MVQPDEPVVQSEETNEVAAPPPTSTSAEVCKSEFSLAEFPCKVSLDAEFC